MIIKHVCFGLQDRHARGGELELSNHPDLQVLLVLLPKGKPRLALF